MKWSIQQLLAKKHSGISVDEYVDVSELIDRDKEIRGISKVKVTGKGEFTGDVVDFTLHITGSMVLPCSRTLADVDFPFDIDVVESFRLDGLPADEEDEAMHEPENGYVDLLPYVKEHILLQIPIQVFAEPHKEGQAPQQGKDWEVVSQDDLQKEQEESIDPRMADLAKYFDK